MKHSKYDLFCHSKHNLFFVSVELLLFLPGISLFTPYLPAHLHTLICTQAGRHWSLYENSHTQIFDTACSSPLQRTARLRGPPVDSIMPNIIGQTSTCIIPVVFKLHSAELRGSAPNFKTSASAFLL